MKIRGRTEKITAAVGCLCSIIDTRLKCIEVQTISSCRDNKHKDQYKLGEWSG